MNFLNQLIERSSAVLSNASQSWHLWGMFLLISLFTDWKKNQGNQYKKSDLRLLNIRKGAFYLERRRERGGWAFFSIYIYIYNFFFSRHMYIYIHSLLSQPTFHKSSKVRVIDLGTYSHSCCIIFNSVELKLHGLLNWFQNHLKCALNSPQVIIRQGTVT